MARISVDGTDLVVRLSLRERAAAGKREIRVPVAAVRRVDVEPSWWRALCGTPGRGTWRAGRCIGTRHTPEGDRFVALRAGGTPVLCVELGAAAAFRGVAVTSQRAQETARTLRALLPPEPPEPPRTEGPDNGAPALRPRLQHEGGIADDHGRPPGVPSRTGTGAQAPADPERVRNAGRVPRNGAPR
ncbi:hypothetical protein [Streptomyces sp. NPDC097981]|uniref:hypothetical protein n=1 Tax=Streptomyces sp. NPDC097981 TaxID=3155428 RepID=UPI003323C9D3